MGKKIYTAEDLAHKVNGNLVGDPDIKINAVAGINESCHNSITFAESKEYIEAARESSAGIIIVPRDVIIEGKTIIQVLNPRLAYAIISSLFVSNIFYKPGIHPSAVISDSARVGQNVSIHPGAIIDENVKLSDDVIVAAGVYIGRDVRVGSNTIIHPNVVIEYGSDIGSNVIIHAGTVIGSDGYGFVSSEQGHQKIPQLGNVIIEDNVEIGANVTVDRGASGPTVIGSGTKIDNLVQIAHNVKIGEDCLIVAHAAIAGSTELGNRVTLAGKTGVIGHITIGDDAIIASDSTVTKDVPTAVFYSGKPAQEHKKELREQAARRKLPELLKTLKKLEKKINKLESEGK
ncbi:MAG: UDP-3-O-(3-hydroxymyristoyl)glucosamine N-acyltransferase [bacterium]